MNFSESLRNWEISQGDLVCPNMSPSAQVPNRADRVKPADVKVVAALGDSLPHMLAGIGANATNILELLTEFRQFSWSGRWQTALHSMAGTRGRDGLFHVTFITMAICKRYWEQFLAAKPDSPFARFIGSCPIKREERRVTVSMKNPHTPGKDIATFLSRFCTVMSDPAQIKDKHGFWTGRWFLIVRLKQDPSSPGNLHLPQCFSLGSSSGMLFYQDQPRNCRKCNQPGHQGKDCKASACRKPEGDGDASLHLGRGRGGTVPKAHRKLKKPRRMAGIVLLSLSLRNW
ncbi:zinc finger CCHC domain-containing 3-like [Pelobates cultripes]|uniref:Zinc finger CCHC domain-containing 3-like n=1 Tax=Pelobates cultripes TaxID=61616 RepID=A0AAD1TM37_PELCU|nr:zinc finger CCHC domain-containing 3-like [Pelobates cultripes]